MAAALAAILQPTVLTISLLNRKELIFLKKLLCVVLVCLVALCSCGNVPAAQADNSAAETTAPVSTAAPETTTKASATTAATTTAPTITTKAKTTANSNDADIQEYRQTVIDSLKNIYSVLDDQQLTITTLNELYTVVCKPIGDLKIYSFEESYSEFFEDYEGIESPLYETMDGVNMLRDTFVEYKSTIDQVVPGAVKMVEDCATTFEEMYNIMAKYRLTYDDYLVDYATAFNNHATALNTLGKFLYDNGHISKSEYHVVSLAAEPQVQTSASQFDEVILIDNSYCLIKAISVDSTDSKKCKVHVYIENKCADQDLKFNLEAATVNGLVCDEFFYETVSAKKKIKAIIELDTSFLSENQCTQFSDILLMFKVYNMDFDTLVEAKEFTQHIYPYGEEKATVFVRKVSESDVLIADNGYIKTYVVGLYSNNYYSCMLDLYLENKTDQTVCFHSDNETINGYLRDTIFIEDVPAHSFKKCRIKWDKDDLAEIGVEDVNDVSTIEFDLLAGIQYNDLRKFGEIPVSLTVS